MNRQEYDILQNIYLNQFENQRILAKQSDIRLNSEPFVKKFDYSRLYR